MTDRALSVVRAGALTTVQDLGRPGHAHLGVPRSGALDGPAHRLANRLVGNPATAATLETTLTGCAVRPRTATTVAVTGAACPVTVDGRPAPWGAPVHVPAGAVLELGAATHGVRCYLACAGGITVEPVLGSRATDLLSGLGPEPLADGTVLPLGCPYGPPAAADAARSPGGGRAGAAVPARAARRLVHRRRATHPDHRPVPGLRGVQPDRAAHRGARPGARPRRRTPQ
ncbi:antagonist of KipI [Streptomyces noursei]|nr:antagonist of KipI [Streptomyces noursei]